MKILILAAGRSRRMQPVRDKNFIDFLGKPLIRWQLDLVEKAGFRDVILVGGKHNLKQFAGLKKGTKLKIETVEQKNLEMGMCGAILAAKKLIKNEPVLVMSSNDIVEEKAFSLVKKAYEKKDADSYIIAKKVKEYFPGGYLKVDKKGYITGIVEKPTPGKEPSDLINLVIHLHTNPQKLIKYLEKAKSSGDDLYEKALDNLIKEKAKIKAVSYDGIWLPIKYPWHIQNVFEYFFTLVSKGKKQIHKTAKVAKSAMINGAVIIDEGAKIMDEAVINGPCYIGKNSVVATNALVRSSHIGENCVIGFGTEVARSHVGNDVWTHTNYIGDSVIGNDVSFGAGTVTGNLRLDERNIAVDIDGKKIDTKSSKFGLITGDNIRVGVNTSFMPGIRIGSDSFIGAGIVIGENIPEKSFVRGEYKLKISKNNMAINKMSRKDFKNKI